MVSIGHLVVSIAHLVVNTAFLEVTIALLEVSTADSVVRPPWELGDCWWYLDHEQNTGYFNIYAKTLLKQIKKTCLP